MEGNYERLLEEVKQGHKVSAEERERIVAQLRSGHCADDPYTLIHILGQLNDQKAFGVIRPYVYYDAGDPDNDAMIRRIALQAIGRMLGNPSAFDDAEERAFHDPSKYVRAAAATILGFLGQRYPVLGSRSAALLLRGLKAEEESYVVESFYFGLLELLGVPPQRWPPVGRCLSRREMQPSVIQRAKDMAKKFRGTDQVL